MLDPETIELANAHGPYSHGVWVAGEAAIGNEEALAGRGTLLVSQIRRNILDRFTAEQIQAMTLVDVGCYDGWITCQLADLPFRRLIGIEPRQKNLDKGREIRSLLGIEARCEFRQGSIENLEAALGGEKADIVICCGVLHHLSSIAQAIVSLRTICRRLLFLESLCLPEIFEGPALRKAMELKDLPLFFGDHGFGVTGHKVESGYYDGSAVGMSVVTLPTLSALRLYLSTHGFANIRVVTDEKSYAKAVGGGWRKFNATCLTAEVDLNYDSGAKIARWIKDYEGGMVRTLLPPPLALALYVRDTLGRKRQAPMVGLLEWLAFSATASKRRWYSNYLLRKLQYDPYVLEICKNLQYARRDKAALEYGKCLIAQRRHNEAEQVLMGITRRLNADWRSVYRAFCLLAWSFKDRGEQKAAARYVELCRIANPQFPVELLNGSISSFRPGIP